MLVPKSLLSDNPIQNYESYMVLQSAADFRKATRYLHKYPKGPHNIRFRKLLKEVCDYLMNVEFKYYTEITGEYILRLLEEEFEDWKETQKC